MLTRARPPTGEGTNGWVTRQSSPREAPKATGLGRCVLSSTVHSSHSMLALCRCMFDRSLQFVNNRGVGWSPAGTFRSRGGSLTRARPQAGAPSVPGGLLTRARRRAGAPSVTALLFHHLFCFFFCKQLRAQSQLELSESKLPVTKILERITAWPSKLLIQ